MRHRAEEEQSSLLVLGHTYREPPRPTRAELVALGIRVGEPSRGEACESDIT